MAGQKLRVLVPKRLSCFPETISGPGFSGVLPPSLGCSIVLHAVPCVRASVAVLVVQLLEAHPVVGCLLCSRVGGLVSPCSSCPGTNRAARLPPLSQQRVRQSSKLFSCFLRGNSAARFRLVGQILERCTKLIRPPLHQVSVPISTTCCLLPVVLVAQPRTERNSICSTPQTINYYSPLSRCPPHRIYFECSDLCACAAQRARKLPLLFYTFVLYVALSILQHVSMHDLSRACSVSDGFLRCCGEVCADAGSEWWVASERNGDREKGSEFCRVGWPIPADTITSEASSLGS